MRLTGPIATGDVLRNASDCGRACDEVKGKNEFKPLCAQTSMCPNLYVPKPLCAQTSMRPNLYAPMIKRLAFAVLLVAVAACLILSPAARSAEQQILEIASKTGVHVFSVEVAVTDEERARGLMYRRSVPESYGMLFDFKRDQEVSMWMRNTYVSLDMIFIQSDGRIRRIAESTETESDKIIPSGGQVRAVLEVAAGTAKKLGIEPGDRVAATIFRR
jgi:uncharacterized protein